MESFCTRPGLDKAQGFIELRLVLSVVDVDVKDDFCNVPFHSDSFYQKLCISIPPNMAWPRRISTLFESITMSLCAGRLSSTFPITAAISDFTSQCEGMMSLAPPNIALI